MAQDIASLGIKIDTSDVAKAERDLDGLNQAGRTTEQAAQKVGAAWEKAAGKISGDTGEIVKQLQALNKTQSATVAALANLDKTASKFGANFGQAAARINDVSSASTTLAKTEKDSARALKVGTESLDQQKQALAGLLGQIDPVVAALNRLDAQEQQLGKFKSGGLIDGAAFDGYKAKIDQARASLNSVNNSIAKTGESSKQTAFALRQLPAQFSDIVISLQGGQNPFSVFLQQGSQIKDSFGGVGNALRETGKYAIGLINPFTLAAAAAAALALAYKQGSDESTAYNKAIILTGNYAGTSAAQLELMAKKLDAGIGTQRQSADALAQIVSTGRFASGQLEGLASAAVAMEIATGKAVSETVDEFVKLADSPAAAIMQLNKSQKFLTAEIYAQIVALEEQGRTTEAAELALRTYSDTMNNRAVQVIDKLGYIEKGWKAVKEGAAEAWDQMLGVGREGTDVDRLSELQQRLQGPSAGAVVGAVAKGGVIGGFGNIAQQIADGFGDQQGAIQAEIDSINKRIAKGAEAAAEEGARQKIEADGAAAIQRIEAQGKAVESNADKRKRALKQLADDIEKISKANSKDPRLDPANVARLRAGINEQYKDPAAKKAPEFRDDAAARMLQSLRQQEASLSEQFRIEGKLSDAQKERAKFEALIADLKEKKILTADQKSLQANQDAIRAQLDKNVSIAEEVRLQTESLKLQERSAQLQQTIAASSQGRREQYDRQLSAFGQGNAAQQQAAEAANIFREFRRYQDELNKSTPKDLLGSAQYLEARDQIGQGLRDALSEHENYYKRLEELQSSSMLGAKAAFANFADDATNVAAQTEALVSGILDSITTGAGSAFEAVLFDAQTLDEALKGLTETVLRGAVNALGEMAAKFAINTALELAGIGAVTTAKTAQAATVAAAQTGAIATTTAAATAATATTTATQTAAAGTVASSWLPAALVASVGSFGAAAIVGGTALLAAFALAKGMEGGFKTGGYTGNGGVNDVAGVVHGKEFVFDAASTQRIGVANLEKIRTGRADLSATGSGSMQQGKSQTTVVTQNFNVSTPNADSFRMSQRQIMRRARQRIT